MKEKKEIIDQLDEWIDKCQKRADSFQKSGTIMNQAKELAKVVAYTEVKIFISGF